MKKRASGDEGEKPGFRSIHSLLLAVIRQPSFRHASWILCGRNPVENVKKPTEDNRRMRFLLDEAESLLGKSRGKRDAGG